MAKLNHSKYAILGLLSTSCNTGYQIKQMMDNSLNHFWKISYGQIYPTLKTLVEEGLAIVQVIPQDGKPDKKEYYLTSKGEEALRVWLSSPLEEIPFYKSEVLLKLFFGRHQDDTKTILYLKEYLEVLHEKLTTYLEIENLIRTHSQDKADAKYWLITLDYGKRIASTEMEWCKDTIKLME
ncbi:PadR family transcriptional regulator [Ornithinibacillus scapharcae]|uniref:PadR family transcriptional regulator n=1 Tax=Ornithinibacillus scapharcae TaxID=1147159 RepID=UPI000225B886|nr:PadR family transcriptional regulator [Ornithinibacillus scapharcae]